MNGPEHRTEINTVDQAARDNGVHRAETAWPVISCQYNPRAQYGASDDKPYCQKQKRFHIRHGIAGPDETGGPQQDKQGWEITNGHDG